MTPKLVAEEGLLKGLTFTLDEGEEWIVGRDPESSQLVVEDPSASRKHLLLKKTADGITVENLSITNPVRVNGQELDKPRLLQSQDTILIGSCLFRYHAESEPQISHNSIDSEEPDEAFISSAGVDGEGMEITADEEVPPPAEPEPVVEPAPVVESEPVVEPEPVVESEPIAEPEPAASVEEPEPVVTETVEEPVEALPVTEEEKEEKPEEEAAPDQDDVADEATPGRDSIFEEVETSQTPPELAHISFDIADTGRWLLKVVSGPNSGAEFAMQTNHTYLIGTDPNSCDIVFHDNSISRQHARLYISQDDTVMVEDIGSRNGSLIDGEKLEGKRSLEPNMLVSLGTTSFVLFDREGEMKTIMSPLLPSIVKSLKDEEKEEKDANSAEVIARKKEEEELQKKRQSRSTFILVGALAAILGLGILGIATLFTAKEVDKARTIDYDQEIRETLTAFPEVRYQFNRSTGNLLLIGHVLTISDKLQLVNAVNELPFVRHIDDKNVVVDEFIWREINVTLARDPNWKGIAIHSPRPGQFVISGYLQTRDQSERLWDYLNANFPYLDLLERRIIVEEILLQDVNTQLESNGFTGVLASMSNGELTLAGQIPTGTRPEFNTLTEEFRKISGLRNVRTFIQEAPMQSAVINISDRYEVSGFSNKGLVNVSVVVNGRIVGVGDKIDNMVITEINDRTIMLERDGVQYRIDYVR